MQEKEPLKDLSKINKFRIFRSQESEEIIEGVILNHNSDKVKVQNYVKQKDTKGKELILGLEVIGDLEIMLDKTNYDLLEKRSYENFTQDLSEGKEAKHMFKLLSQEGTNYKVLI